MQIVWFDTDQNHSYLKNTKWLNIILIYFLHNILNCKFIETDCIIDIDPNSGIGRKKNF